MTDKLDPQEVARQAVDLERRRQAGERWGAAAWQRNVGDLAELITAVDRFCDTLPARGYRPSVTVRREASAAGQTWTFLLDGQEIGRYIVGRDRAGWGKAEVYTALAEGCETYGGPSKVPEEVMDRHRLFGDIMARLGRHLAKWFAERRRKVRRGLHGDTLDRVTEARALIETGACSKTEACKRCRVDTRTYDKWLERVLDVDAE